MINKLSFLWLDFFFDCILCWMDDFWGNILILFLDWCFWMVMLGGFICKWQGGFWYLYVYSMDVQECEVNFLVFCFCGRDFCVGCIFYYCCVGFFWLFVCYVVCVFCCIRLQLVLVGWVFVFFFVFQLVLRFFFFFDIRLLFIFFDFGSFICVLIKVYFWLFFCFVLVWSIKSQLFFFGFCFFLFFYSFFDRDNSLDC